MSTSQVVSAPEVVADGLAGPVRGEVLPGDVLASVRGVRARVVAAEVELLVLACAWADAHPALPASRPCLPYAGPDYLETGGPGPDADEEETEWFGIDEIAWDAPAPFAAANGMSTAAGKALIRDALVLRGRLPRVWARLMACQVPVWRARRIAQTVLGQPDDVVAYLDQEIAPVAESIGTRGLELTLDAGLLLLHAEAREVAQLEALDARYARLEERSFSHTGLAEFVVRGEWKDVADFNDTVAQVAAVLAETEEGRWQSVDVRRARAVGILADPQAALALLACHGSGDASGRAVPGRRGIQLYVHLNEANLTGLDPVAWDETRDRVLLEQQVRDWCGRDDASVRVTPVIDLHQPAETDGYRIPARIAEQVRLADPRCVFPHCHRPARRCDLDHIDPYDSDDPGGGVTSTANLAPLCRHHHRLKTHAGWRYQRLAPRIYLWTEPHGQQFLTHPDGTTDIGP